MALISSCDPESSKKNEISTSCILTLLKKLVKTKVDKLSRIFFVSIQSLSEFRNFPNFLTGNDLDLAEMETKRRFLGYFVPLFERRNSTIVDGMIPWLEFHHEISRLWIHDGERQVV